VALRGTQAVTKEPVARNSNKEGGPEMRITTIDWILKLFPQLASVRFDDLGYLVSATNAANHGIQDVEVHLRLGRESDKLYFRCGYVEELYHNMRVYVAFKDDMIFAPEPSRTYHYYSSVADDWDEEDIKGFSLANMKVRDVDLILLYEEYHKPFAFPPKVSRKWTIYVMDSACLRR
jgi:hypothetical protein